MNRNQITIFLKDFGFSTQKINKLLNNVCTIQDFVKLVPEYGNVLKYLILHLYGFKSYKVEAYDKNVWILLKSEQDIGLLDKLATLLRQNDNQTNRYNALLNYYVNDLNQGVCETWKLKNFLMKYNEVLDNDETLYTSIELLNALNDIKNFL